MIGYIIVILCLCNNILYLPLDRMIGQDKRNQDLGSTVIGNPTIADEINSRVGSRPDRGRPSR